MPRNRRISPTGEVFHVPNRAVAQPTIFETPSDYTSFVKVVGSDMGTSTIAPSGDVILAAGEVGKCLIVGGRIKCDIPFRAQLNDDQPLAIRGRPLQQVIWTGAVGSTAQKPTQKFFTSELCSPRIAVRRRKLGSE